MIVMNDINNPHLLDPRPMEGPIKSPVIVHLFARLSVHCKFGIFLRNGALVFSDFWHYGR